MSDTAPVRRRNPDRVCIQLTRGGPWHVLGDASTMTVCGKGSHGRFTSSRASGIRRDESRCTARACADAWLEIDAGRR